MLSSANQSTFNIRNSGGGAPGSWEWRTSGILESSTTVELPAETTWSSGVVTIDDSPLLDNSDRFAPDSVAYLIGHYDGDYYGFRFGVWNDRTRFRLYGVEAATVTFATTPVAEAGSFALMASLLAGGFVLVRRRRRS